MNIWNLTDHQLEVIKTIAIVGGNAGTFIGMVFVPILIRFVVQTRRAARNAEHQTRREEWADGSMHTVDVSELASNAVTNAAEAKHQIKLSTQELRQEITDMWNDPTIPKEHGRRRLSTDVVRTINLPGDTNE